MNFSKILVEHVCNTQLNPGETIVGAVPLHGGDKIILVTNTGRLLSVELEWY